MRNKLTYDELFEKYSSLLGQYKSIKENQQYGLVWEMEDEEAIEYLRDNDVLPILTNKITHITNKNEPMNIILNGENFDALTILQYTHILKNDGIIDFILIDPPYNRGENDLIYKDKYTYKTKKKGKEVKKDDIYYHSKWLNFMYTRISLAYNLLKSSGMMAISIDSNELYSLKLLCDKIFGEENYRGNLIRKENAKKQKIGKPSVKEEHEYLLLYSKTDKYFMRYSEKKSYKEYEGICNKIYTQLKKNAIHNPELEFNLLIKGEKQPNYSDEAGVSLDKLNEDIYKLLRKAFVLHGIDKGLAQYKFIDNESIYRSDNLNMTLGRDHNYLIKNPFDENKYLLNPKHGLPDKQKFLSTGDFFEDDCGNLQVLFPNKIDIIAIDKNGPTYRYSNIIFKDGNKIASVTRLNPTTTPDSVMMNFMGSDDRLMQKMGLNFDYPKPKEYIKYLIDFFCPQDGIVLDFFAGSGTTGHAVLELNKENKESGKYRQFILCTNNENNICTEVTIPRILKCIDGYEYRTKKSIKKESALGGNISVFDIEYIKFNSNNKIKLNQIVASKCFDILSIREESYVFDMSSSSGEVAFFENIKGDKLLCIYIGNENYSGKDFFIKMKQSLHTEKVLYKIAYAKINDYEDDGISIKHIPIELLEYLKLEDN